MCIIEHHPRAVYSKYDYILSLNIHKNCTVNHTEYKWLPFCQTFCLVAWGLVSSIDLCQNSSSVLFSNIKTLYILQNIIFKYFAYCKLM